MPEHAGSLCSARMELISMSQTEQNRRESEAPVTTFADLGLSKAVLAAVEDMGYTNPTPVQAASIPEALAGRDVLAAAQTGTGKTAAFLLPTMDKLGHVKRTRGRGREAAGGPLMLVVTPTRELAQQIEKVCRAISKRTGHYSVTVVGGLSYNPQKDALRRGCDVLIATPGRLQDLIDQGACNLDQVEVLVLDEADRMLDMGFLPAVRKIVSYTRDDRQTLLFSATLDEKAVGQITDLVRDPARVEIAPVTSTADTVAQYVLPVSLEAKNGTLIDVLKREGAERVIVFTRTKHRADTACRRLARAGITCAAIHGDRTQAQRQRALQAFRSGKCDVLVATDVLARGIDITDVRYVINFDVPEEPVDYIHRIGRTGRAGEEGWSVTFVTKDDVAEFYDIEALMGKTADRFDENGLDCGEDRPEVDPERVPAKAPAGKKEKKRRRARAKRAEQRARRDGGRRGGEQASDRPARRKRSGKTRVPSADEGGELLSAAEVRSERGGRGNSNREGKRADGAKKPNRAERRRQQFGDADERGGRGERGGQRRDDRDGRRNGNRGGNGRGGNGSRSGQRRNDSREAWRNYDEPSARSRRGGRGQYGGADRSGRVNSNYENRGGQGKTRRPGDRGGKRK